MDKPAGITSHKLVLKVRRVINPSGASPKYKVGHTGTLDLAATGLMILTVGKATKETSLFQGLDKVYWAEVELGKTTSTYDGKGKVLSEKPYPTDEKLIRETLLSFQGLQDQLPPPYSAKKIGGKKAYQLAKKGVEVPLKKKRITIYSIEIENLDLPYLRFIVHCSSGTYIRSLAFDLGQKLGCGAYLRSLRRLKVGPYSVEASHTLEEVQEMGKKGREALESILLPVQKEIL